jgi:two-component system sensor histidine kinase FlrB
MTFAFNATAEEHQQQDFWSSQQDKLSFETYPGELAELRQQCYQQKQVIEAMPTGLVILDGNGIVVKVNKVARNFLDEPIMGQAWFDVIKRSFKPRADDWHEVSLKDGRRVKLEISPLDNQPGQLIVITDLTETRLLQDKISQMQRLSSLGRMVSSLAHQIRTPLSAAMLYGANLATPNLSIESKRNFQSKLMSRLQDLESQVNDMLLFAKSGKDQLVEPMSINGLIQEVSQGMDGLIKKANAELIVKPCQHDCQIIGNKSALSGAIQNLVQNSLQATTTQAVITIETACYDEHVFINIKDNGKGIDSELADKIFEPFYTSKINGTGLGLAVVKSVVKSHQGEIRLLATPDRGDENSGAEFSIRLPLTTAKLKATELNSNTEKVNSSSTLEDQHE